MTQRYKIKAHESGNGDGNVDTGTLVVHLGGGGTVDADSMLHAEATVRKEIRTGALPAGRVYQICPSGMTASILSLAVALDGAVSYCELRPAAGIYSGFCRICRPQPKPANEQLQHLRLAS